MKEVSEEDENQEPENAGGKRLTKAKVAKKLLRKGITANTRVVFDDEGQVSQWSWYWSACGVVNVIDKYFCDACSCKLVDTHALMPVHAHTHAHTHTHTHTHIHTHTHTHTYTHTHTHTHTHTNTHTHTYTHTHTHTHTHARTYIHTHTNHQTYTIVRRQESFVGVLSFAVITTLQYQ